MKRTYERPLMTAELFMPNQAVASCSVLGGISYTFDCMAGPNTDPGVVISSDIAGSSCTNDVGYANGASIARDLSKNQNSQHSDNNPGRAIWGGTSSYLQVSYSGAQGLLYADAADAGNGGGKPGFGSSGGSSNNFNKNYWYVLDGIVYHKNESGLTHHMVAPVISLANMSSSW